MNILTIEMLKRKKKRKREKEHFSVQKRYFLFLLIVMSDEANSLGSVDRDAHEASGKLKY